MREITRSLRVPFARQEIKNVIFFSEDCPFNELKSFCCRWDIVALRKFLDGGVDIAGDRKIDAFFCYDFHIYECNKNVTRMQ